VIGARREDGNAGAAADVLCTLLASTGGRAGRNEAGTGGTGGNQMTDIRSISSLGAAGRPPERGRIRSLLAAAACAVGSACSSSGTGPPPPPPPPPPGPPAPAINLDLALGGSVTLSEPAQVRAFQIDGSNAQRDYQIIVQRASAAFGGSTSMRLHMQAADATASVVELPSTRLRPTFSTVPPSIARRLESGTLEDRLRESTRRELRRIGAQPIRASASQPGGPRFSISSSAPTVGQMMSFGFAITSSLQADCDATATIDAEVKFVGNNFAIAEDVQVAGTYSSSDYANLGQLLDQTIYPIETAYFGNPADIDDNGVVVALVTAEVNRLSARGSPTLIAGFFWGGDLFDTQDCAASNEAEMFYLIAPDPAGTFSDAISIEEGLSLGRTTVAHEFFHLLNTQQRTTIGGGSSSLDGEDAWLDEGLAHLAEELVGFGVAGLSTRANLDLDGLIPPSSGNPVFGEAFNDFHFLNVLRVADFMLHPSSTMALGNSGGSDPGGTESLRMRGFGYLVARWLGDQFGPSGNGAIPGSNEQMLFRELSSGGPAFLAGADNIERAVQVVGGQSVAWEDLLASFLGMLAVDDAGLGGLDPLFSSKSWNYPELFLRLSQEQYVDAGGNPVPPPSVLQNEYPLIPDVLALGSGTNISRTFTVNSSTGSFFVVRGGTTTPDAVFEVTTSTGADLPSSAAPQVTIIRTR